MWKRENRTDMRRNQVFGEVLLVLVIAFVSELSIPYQSILQKGIWVLIAFLGILTNRFYLEKVKKDSLIQVLFLMPVPIIMAAMYTVLFCFFNGDRLGIGMQACTTALYVVADVLMAAALAGWYKEDCVKIVCLGTLCSYALTILIAVSAIGLEGIVSNLKEGNPAYLEKHDVGVAVVPFILFYLYFPKEKTEDFRKNIIRLVMLAGVTFMCGKRSAYVALAVGILLLLAQKLLKKNREKVTWFVLAGTYIGCFVYVYAIRRGILYFLGSLSAFKDRLHVWKWFDGYYEVVPTYPGQGFQFIHRYMVAGLGDEMVNAFDYLHNSILQIYIETGFFGFFAWFGFLLIILPVMVRKKLGEKCFLFFSVLQVTTVVMFSVDNVLTYPLYQVSFFTVFYGVYFLTQKRTYREEVQNDSQGQHYSSRL